MTTDLFGTTPATPSATASAQRSGRRVVSLGIAASAALAMFIGGMGATASAAPGETADGPTVMSVNVASSIQFTIEGTFALTAGVIVPGTPVAGSVDWSVGTNSESGYSVAFLPELTNAAAVMTSPDTDDQILLSTVTWDDSQNGTVDPVGISATSNAVWTQATRSAPAEGESLGDSHTNDFALTVPFVDSAVYSATLNYTATATE